MKARSVADSLSKYRSAALEVLDNIEHGDPQEYLASVGLDPLRKAPLSKIWLPPTFRHRADFEERGEVDLEELLGDPAGGALILAGAGHGKSTVIRYVLCTYLRAYRHDEARRFPIYVPLRSLRIPGEYEDAVLECAATAVGLDAEGPVTRALEVVLPTALLLFDGFDELPKDPSADDDADDKPILRDDGAELIRYMITRRDRDPGAMTPRIKTLITCRSDLGDDPGRLFLTAASFVLQKLPTRKVRSAVERWHDAAKSMVVDSAAMLPALDERRNEILALLHNHPDVASLCLSPLMLNILQTTYSGEGYRPSSVSDLCEWAARTLLIERHGAKTWDIPIDQETWILSALAEIGKRIHEKSLGERIRSLDTDEIRAVVASEGRRLRQEAHSHRRYDSNAVRDQSAAKGYAQFEASVTTIVLRLILSNGILEEGANRRFDFVEDVVREVMAGEALRKLDITSLRPLTEVEKWVGPLRYWAGRSGNTSGGQDHVSALVGELESTGGGRGTVQLLVKAEMLSQAYDPTAGANISRDLSSRVEQVREELVDSLSRPDLLFRHRVRIGELLGLLGDPRLEEPLLLRTVWIPGGSAIIGRAANHVTRHKKYRECPAAPQMVGELQPFGISAYPVTNAEYRAFINGGGYAQRKYWRSKTARQWLQRDGDYLKLLIRRAQAEAPIHMSSELIVQRALPEDTNQRCEEMIDRKEPLTWFDPAFNRHNQPVVGVNLWEALAYCCWLTEALHDSGELPADLEVGLPIEAEWETAGRRSGRHGRYPWVRGKASTNAHIRLHGENRNEQVYARSCAVGLFAFVETDLAICDLVGNTWEWTGSLAKPYASSAFEQRIDEGGLECRVTRGTSWLCPEVESNEVTFRSLDPPYNAYDDLGMRVVIRRSR